MGDLTITKDVSAQLIKDCRNLKLEPEELAEEEINLVKEEVATAEQEEKIGSVEEDGVTVIEKETDTVKEKDTTEVEKKFLSDCRSLGERTDVTEDVVKELVVLWTNFQGGLKDESFVYSDRCLESVLVCTAKLILSVQFSKQVSAGLKKELKDCIRSCGEQFGTDSIQQNHICVGIASIIDSPWSSSGFKGVICKGEKSVAKISDDAANALWKTEGWVMLEARIDNMIGSARKGVLYQRAFAVLHVLVKKGHQFYGLGDLRDVPKKERERYEPYRFPWSRYLEYLEVYAILLYKGYGDTQDISNWERGVLKSVVTALTCRAKNQNCERVFAKMRYWNLVDDVAKDLVKKATWSVLQSQNADMVEDFFMMWMELNNSQNSLSPLDEIIEKLDEVSLTENMYRIASAAISYLGRTKVTRSKFVEVYVRAMTKDMNETEHLKINNPNSKDKIRELDRKLSFRYVELARFFKDYPKTATDCILTAFSLNPCDKLFSCLFPDSQHITKKVNGLGENDLSTDGAGDLQEIQIQLGNDDVKLEDDLDLSTSLLCDDLETVIHNPRYKGLFRWNSRKELEDLCYKLLEDKSVDVIENRTLEDVIPDYDKYKDFPSQYDPEDDGIEKGYRLGEKRKSKRAFVRRDNGRARVKNSSLKIRRNALNKARHKGKGVLLDLNSDVVTMGGNALKLGFKNSNRGTKSSKFNLSKGRARLYRCQGAGAFKKIHNPTPHSNHKDVLTKPNLSLGYDPWIPSASRVLFGCMQTGEMFTQFTHPALHECREKLNGRNFNYEEQILLSHVKQTIFPQDETPIVSQERGQCSNDDNNGQLGSSQKNDLGNEGEGRAIKQENGDQEPGHSRNDSEAINHSSEQRHNLTSLNLHNSWETFPIWHPFFACDDFPKDPYHQGLMGSVIHKAIYLNSLQQINKKTPNSSFPKSLDVKKGRKKKSESNPEKIPCKKQRKSISTVKRKQQNAVVEDASSVKPEPSYTAPEKEITSVEESSVVDADASILEENIEEEPAKVEEEPPKVEEELPKVEEEPAVPAPEPIMCGAFQIMRTFKVDDRPMSTEKPAITPQRRKSTGSSTKKTPTKEQMDKWEDTVGEVSRSVNETSNQSEPKKQPFTDARQTSQNVPPKPQVPIKVYSNPTKAKRRLVIDSKWFGSSFTEEKVDNQSKSNERIKPESGVSTSSELQEYLNDVVYSVPQSISPNSVKVSDTSRSDTDLVSQACLETIGIKKESGGLEIQQRLIEPHHSISSRFNADEQIRTNQESQEGMDDITSVTGDIVAKNDVSKHHDFTANEASTVISLPEEVRALAEPTCINLQLAANSINSNSLTDCHLKNTEIIVNAVSNVTSMSLHENCLTEKINTKPFTIREETGCEDVKRDDNFSSYSSQKLNCTTTTKPSTVVSLNMFGNVNLLRVNSLMSKKEVKFEAWNSDPCIASKIHLGLLEKQDKTNGGIGITTSDDGNPNYAIVEKSQDSHQPVNKSSQIVEESMNTPQEQDNSKSNTEIGFTESISSSDKSSLQLQACCGSNRGKEGEDCLRRNNLSEKGKEKEPELSVVNHRAESYPTDNNSPNNALLTRNVVKQISDNETVDDLKLTLNSKYSEIDTVAKEVINYLLDNVDKEILLLLEKEKNNSKPDKVANFNLSEVEMSGNKFKQLPHNNPVKPPVNNDLVLGIPVIEAANLIVENGNSCDSVQLHIMSSEESTEKDQGTTFAAINDSDKCSNAETEKVFNNKDENLVSRDSPKPVSDSNNSAIPEVLCITLDSNSSPPTPSDQNHDIESQHDVEVCDLDYEPEINFNDESPKDDLRSRQKTLRPVTPVERLEEFINEKLIKSKVKAICVKYQEEEDKIRVAPSVLKHREEHGYPLMRLAYCTVLTPRLKEEDIPLRFRSHIKNPLKRSSRLQVKSRRTVKAISDDLKRSNSNEDDKESTSTFRSRSSSPEIEIIEEFVNQKSNKVSASCARPNCMKILKEEQNLSQSAQSTEDEEVIVIKTTSKTHKGGNPPRKKRIISRPGSDASETCSSTAGSGRKLVKRINRNNRNCNATRKLPNTSEDHNLASKCHMASADSSPMPVETDSDYDPHNDNDIASKSSSDSEADLDFDNGVSPVASQSRLRGTTKNIKNKLMTQESYPKIQFVPSPEEVTVEDNDPLAMDNLSHDSLANTSMADVKTTGITVEEITVDSRSSSDTRDDEDYDSLVNGIGVRKAVDEKSTITLGISGPEFAATEDNSRLPTCSGQEFEEDDNNITNEHNGQPPAETETYSRKDYNYPAEDSMESVTEIFPDNYMSVSQEERSNYSEMLAVQDEAAHLLPCMSPHTNEEEGAEEPIELYEKMLLPVVPENGEKMEKGDIDLPTDSLIRIGSEAVTEDCNFNLQEEATVTEFTNILPMGGEVDSLTYESYNEESGNFHGTDEGPEGICLEMEVTPFPSPRNIVVSEELVEAETDSDAEQTPTNLVLENIVNSNENSPDVCVLISGGAEANVVDSDTGFSREDEYPSTMPVDSPLLSRSPSPTPSSENEVTKISIAPYPTPSSDNENGSPIESRNPSPIPENSPVQLESSSPISSDNEINSIPIDFPIRNSSPTYSSDNEIIILSCNLERTNEPAYDDEPSSSSSSSDNSEMPPVLPLQTYEQEFLSDSEDEMPILEPLSQK